MTNPTRQEIISAHEALEDMHHIARKTTEKWDEEGITDFWKSLILKALPPRPRPTMAEVEWDDDEHFLAEAEQTKYGQAIMLGLDETGFIEFFVPRLRECRYDAAHPDTLTPTGRRYTLTEVQE